MKKLPGPVQQVALTLLLLLSVIPVQSAESSAPVVCRADDNPAFALRKSITILSLAIENPQGAADMPDLGSSVAGYLGQALQQGEEMRVRDGSHHAFDSRRITLLGLVDTRLNAQLAHLGRELDSQLIVSGRITDLSVKAPNNRVKKALTSLVPGFGETRIFALELAVYDSYSGTELLRKPYQTQASGTINMLGMQPLKGRFLDTDYGSAISTLLDEAAGELQNALSCIPLMTTITRIEGTTVQIKEGNGSLLRPGDRLRLFHRQPSGIDKLGNEQFIEEYVSDAYASRIFPDSATLELKDAQAASRLRPGDIARAW
jgi:phage baseplate assembly protein W